MPSPRSTVDVLSQCFRALGDPTRLRLVGLLARRPHYGEELADFLGLTPPTVSHHLRILRDAGLVDSYRQSRHVLFALDLDTLIEVRESLREGQHLPELLGIPDEETLSARTVERWQDQEGRVVSLPPRRRARAAVLRWIAAHLETDRLYPERELRLILLGVAHDPDLVRDGLLEENWLQRAGTVYRRVEEVDAL